MAHNMDETAKWDIKDIFIVLVFVFGIINIFMWLATDFLETFVIIQKYFIITAVQTSAVILTLVYFNIIKGITWRQLGINFKQLSKVIKEGLLGGLVLFGVVVAAGMLVEYLVAIEIELQPFAQLVIEADNYGDLIMLLIIGSVLAPIGEEIYFRGLVYPAFKNRWGLKLGMLFSGIFFALLHFDLLRFIPLMLGGIGLSYIYERSGSIFSCMIAHGFWNAIMILVLYFTI